MKTVTEREREREVSLRRSFGERNERTDRQLDSLSIKLKYSSLFTSKTNINLKLYLRS